MIYFISDTHFGHSNILSFERTNFKTIEEHDEYILSLLKKLTAEDVLYHLGDFAFYLSEEVKKKWLALPCKKILILGNHDLYSFCRNYFDEVYRQPVFLTKQILLSHEPEKCSSYVLNIHGHLHGSYLDSKNYINANIHMLDYKLYSMKQAEKYIVKNLPPRRFIFGQEWYYDMQVFTNKKDDLVLDKSGKINVEATKELLNNFTVSKKIDNREIKVYYYAKHRDNILFSDGQRYYLESNDLFSTARVFRQCSIHKASKEDIRHKRWKLTERNGMLKDKVEFLEILEEN